MRRTLAVLAALLFSFRAQAQAPQMPELPDDAAIAAILEQRIETDRQGVGIVVGLLDEDGQRFVAHGRYGAQDPRAVGADTIFEIGSITKVFTALLLADMVERGEVRLDDPVARYLPPDVTMPERGGRQITLIDLATHTSGLPRMPANFRPADPAEPLGDPYADYTEAELYAFLAAYELPRDIGTQFEYSNLGAALLGHALALRAGIDYQTLVATRILEPLGMSDTAFAVSDAQAGRLAAGHDAQLQPVPNWRFDVFAPAGGLRSTARDMLKFLAAASGVTETPLAPAFALMLATTRPIDPAQGAAMGLGWLLAQKGEFRIAWHNGGTGGYRSFAGFRPGAAVIALSNTSTAMGVDDIGMHLLNPASPLAPQPKQHVAVAIDPALYDYYVGRYSIAPDFVLTVTREGDRLFVEASGQKKYEVFPEAETQFFYKVVDAQLTFVTGPDGRATQLILHQNGRDMPGPRIE